MYELATALFDLLKLQNFSLNQFKIFLARERWFREVPIRVEHPYTFGCGWEALSVVRMIYCMVSSEDRRLHEIVLATVNFDLQKRSCVAWSCVERLRLIIANLNRVFSTCVLG